MTPVKRSDRKTWVGYDPKNCKNCWAGCCTLEVDVNVPDLVRLKLVDPDKELRDEINRLLMDGLITHFNFEEKTGVLGQIGIDCMYLDPVKRTCLVYDKRPDTCRDFPGDVGVSRCPCSQTPLLDRFDDEPQIKEDEHDLKH